MQALTCEEIIQATNGVLVSGGKSTVFYGISTDSRKINPGELFVPIVGQRFDGHDYIAGSLQSGAAGTLTHRDTDAAEGKVIIRVQDTLRALGDIARFYRQKFKIPFVGVTGSVGKTSTKEMISSVLGQKFKVLKNEGNLNNEIGLPLTIFNLDDSHEAAVVEMGMSGFGEISYLASIVKPDIAVITNIGLSHIEKLGSRQNILKAKMEIFEGLRENGTVILNGDDNLLNGLRDLLRFKTVYYGMGEGLDYSAYNVKTAGEHGTRFEISMGCRDYSVEIHVPGVHNVYNALAAIAVGRELKVSEDMIIKGIAEFNPGKMRLNIISHKGMKVINDAYNASPQSMEAALDVLKDMTGAGRKIAVLGDMLEMGEYASRVHYDVGKFAVSRGIEYIITVGVNGRDIGLGALKAGAEPGKVISFENNSDAAGFLADFVKAGDVVLVKGSRRMKMEEIVERLTDKI